MPTTGQDLIAAIVGNERLMGINNCPGVSVGMGQAFYGAVQNDDDEGTLTSGDDYKKQILNMIGFSGRTSETAVWHFSTTGKIHHFVVVPWYRQTPSPGRLYTVFMAYEGKYTLDQYIKGRSPAPPRALNGYQEIWNANELVIMLEGLLKTSTAWERYFGRVGKGQTDQITYYKYKDISLDSAITNVNAHV